MEATGILEAKDPGNPLKIQVPVIMIVLLAGICQNEAAADALFNDYGREGRSENTEGVLDK